MHIGMLMPSNPEKMRATKLQGPMDLRIQSFPMPKPTMGRVLLRVSVVGICTSGLKMLEDPSHIDQHFWDIPGFPGHETAAVVTEIGPRVTTIQPGDRVVPTGTPPCGTCYFCRRGKTRFCERQDFRNLDHMSYAEYMVCDASSLLLIPDNLSDEEASFAEPLACCIGSLQKCSLEVGDHVVVIGAGTMGLLHIQILKSMGARPIVIELDETRRDFALEMGAIAGIIVNDDLPGTIKDITEGRGAASVIVTPGSTQAIQLSFHMVMNGGTVMLFAGTWPPSTIELDPNLIHYRQINLTGTVGTTMYDYERALELMVTGAVDVKPLITGCYPLENVMKAHEASQDLSTYKILVKP